MTTEEQLTKAALVILGTIAYAIGGYVTKVREDDRVEFDRVKFGKTVLVGVIAGLVMVLQDLDDYEVAIAIAVPLVDKLLNHAASV